MVSEGPARRLAAIMIEQRIKFCTAPDGVGIAYAVVGQGRPLLKAPNWMHHLEYDWQSPIWSHLLQALAANYTLVRFDQRGNGLSDWDVPEISFEAHVSDLETVADAAGFERFDLLGISQGCPISIAYAVRHPDRIRRLVLYGGFARGFKHQGSEALAQRAAAEEAMILQGWGQNNPAFRQYFTTRFMPGVYCSGMLGIEQSWNLPLAGAASVERWWGRMARFILGAGGIRWDGLRF